MGLLTTVNRLLSEYGESATLIQRVLATGDGGGGRVFSETTEIPVQVLSILDSVELKTIAPELVGVESHTVLLSTTGLSEVPEIDDMLKIRGATKVIRKTSQVFLKGENVFFELVLSNV